MKLVYSSQNPSIVHHIKNLLENDNIKCIVKNENLLSAIGELPPTEIWAELWILNDSEYAKAKAIIESIIHTVDPGGRTWRCRRCGEEIEHQFTDCWNCGESRPGLK